MIADKIWKLTNEVQRFRLRAVILGQSQPAQNRNLCQLFWSVIVRQKGYDRVIVVLGPLQIESQVSVHQPTSRQQWDLDDQRTNSYSVNS